MLLTNDIKLLIVHCSDTNDSEKFDNTENKNNKSSTRNESFPAVSLSVKNPVSSKVLTLLVFLQVLSNIGILYFLYLVME